ncbi:MAG: hypothetical protein E6Q32_01675 [Neisseriales bacterium]|nr:MAG: hypothetical protein E6Q32_01675 [Neisseriales bacterium]
MHKVKWGEFKLGDLFEFEAIKQAKSQREIPTDNTENGVPYIVQSLFNNMFSRTVNKKWLIDNNEVPVSGNRIVLGVTLPAVSYQPREFGASQVITAKANWLNEKNGIFISIAISRLMYQFSYGRKPGMQIYKDMLIQLPIKNGKIDFEFMESFIAELEAQRIAELEAYLLITGLKDYTLTTEEQHVLKDFEQEAYGEFLIDSIFEKLNLKNHNKAFDKLKDTSTTKTNEFNLSLVNAKLGNNGIMFYGREKDFDSAEMTIDVISNGAVATGTVYAQPYKTGVLWDAYLLKPIAENMSKQKLLYMATALQKSIKTKFGWEDKAVWSKVQHETILLPTINKQPNYAIMEIFISAIQKLVIKDVVLYADKKIAATKKVVNI